MKLPRSVVPVAPFLALGAALLLIFAVWWLLTEPGRARSRAAQAELNARTATAAANSGAVAAGAVAGNAKAAAETDRVGRVNSDAIDNAPDAGVRAPGVFDAQRRGLCERAAYKRDPLCVQPPGGAASGGDAGRAAAAK